MANERKRLAGCDVNQPALGRPLYTVHMINFEKSEGQNGKNARDSGNLHTRALRSLRIQQVKSLLPTE
jgi:hypothetical protein